MIKIILLAIITLSGCVFNNPERQDRTVHVNYETVSGDKDSAVTFDDVNYETVDGKLDTTATFDSGPVYRIPANTYQVKIVIGDVKVWVYDGFIFANKEINVDFLKRSQKQ